MFNRLFTILMWLILGVYICLQLPPVQQEIIDRLIHRFGYPATVEVEWGIIPFVLKARRVTYRQDALEIIARDTEITVDWRQTIDRRTLCLGVYSPEVTAGPFQGEVKAYGYLESNTVRVRLHQPLPLLLTLENTQGQVKVTAHGTADVAQHNITLHHQGVLNLSDMVYTVCTLEARLQNPQQPNDARPMQNHDVHLAQPFTIAVNREIPNIKMLWNGRRIDVGNLKAPQLGHPEWHGEITVPDIPLNILDAKLQGTAGLTARLSGRGHIPSVTANVTVKALRHEAAKGFTTSVTGKVNWNPDTSDSLNIDCRTQITPLLSVHISGDAGLSSTRPHRLRCIADADLKAIETFLPIEDKVRGLVHVNTDVTGTWPDLRFQGDVTLNAGSYENTYTGTRIKGISGHGALHNRKLTITRLSGYDKPVKESRRPQTVTGTGGLDLSDLTAVKCLLTLSFNDFQIAASESFFARATGALNLTGPLTDLKIDGDAVLESSILRLEEVGLGDIPKIRIIKPDHLKKEKKPVAQVVPMSIRLTTRKGIRILGFGFDSRWQGNISVEGFLSDNWLQGQISIERGTFNFLGQKLKLIKGSTIIYDAIDPREPVLNIKAGRNIKNGLDVYLLLSGRTPDIKVKFASSPMLGQEDIISYLLFAKKSTEIGVVQAVQVATAASSLQGAKGLNLIDNLRQGLRLNSIDIKEYQDEKDGQKRHALSIAKELGVATVSIDQGTSSDSSKITVSAPIRKNVTIEADVGGSQQGSGVGITWSKRY